MLEPTNKAIWDTTTKKALYALATFNFLGFSPDDSQFAVWDRKSGLIMFYATADGSLLRSITLANYEACNVTISPDWQQISGCQKHEPKGIDLVLFNAADGSLAKVLSKHMYAERAVFSSDNKVLATSSIRGCINYPALHGCAAKSGVFVWRVKDGAILLNTPSYEGNVEAIGFKSDNSIVYVAFDRLIGGRYPTQWRLR